MATNNLTNPTLQPTCSTCKATVSTERDLREHAATAHAIIDAEYVKQQLETTTEAAMTICDPLAEADGSWYHTMKALDEGTKSVEQIKQMAEVAADVGEHVAVDVCGTMLNMIKHLRIVAGNTLPKDSADLFHFVEMDVQNEEDKIPERVAAMQEAVRKYCEGAEGGGGEKA